MFKIKNTRIVDRLKQSTPDSAFIQPQTKEEKGTSYLEYWAKLGKRLTAAQPPREELLKKLFPRGPETMVAVNAKTGKSIAMDSAIKPAMYNNDLPPEMEPFFTSSFIGWQACALLAQNPYIRKACEIPARDAIAVDYKLQYLHPETDGDDKTDEIAEENILNQLKERADRELKIKDLCRDANIFKKTFGQIIIIPTFNIDMREAMEKPYTPTAIKKGTYTGLTLVQPFWVTYQLNGNGVARPDKQGYYEPEYYIVNADVKIHKSWVIKLINGAIADILKPVYYYGGIPLTQQIYERVFCAEKTANEAPKLALTKRLLIVDGNINALAANPEEAYSTLKNVLDVRDNMGVMVKNPGDAVSQLDTSLADMDALIMTQFQLVAAIAEMPVTKMMKTQLKGLANSGNYELEDYNQTLVEIQENDFDTILNKHFEYDCLSTYGRDLHIGTVWQPIDTPTELELADIEQKQAMTDEVYIRSGVVDASEIRTALRNNEDSRFHNLADEMPEPDLGLDFAEEDGEE